MSTVSPLQAAIGALVADLGAVAVGFGVINNSLAGVLITAVTGAVGVAFIAFNELRHNTNAKLAALPSAKK